MTLRFREDFLRRYLEIAPAALAIERSLECELLSKQKFERPILDLGYGDGVFAQILFGEPVDVGVDVDPDEVERARRLAQYTELITAPGDAIPKESASFRTIVSNSVLEHIQDLSPVVAEAYRLLAPGGRFFVTIPSDQFEHYSFLARILDGLKLVGLSRRFRRLYNRFWMHYNADSPDDWARRFETAGFRVVESQLYNPRGICTLNDLLIFPSLPALVSKKLLDRWIAFPTLRRSYAWGIYAVAKAVTDRLKKQSGGGLIFLTLTKDG